MAKLGKSENVLEAKWSIDYLVIDLMVKYCVYYVMTL